MAAESPSCTDAGTVAPPCPADATLSAGHLTPDPPSVWKHVAELGSDSDSLPSCAKTPPETTDGREVPRLEIAEELQRKLHSVRFSQKWQRGPWGKADETTSVVFGDDSSVQWELPPPVDVQAPPPPPPYGAPRSSAEGADTVAAPPAPPPTALEGAAPAARRAREGHAIIISIGSVGHPTECGAPCKYARRKGGCRDGAACTKCHQCQWRRQPSGAEVPARARFSVGTMGHPDTCGPACKYVRRKEGCLDGAGCLHCHLCQWQRGARGEAKEAAPADAQGSDAQPMYVNAGAGAAAPMRAGGPPQMHTLAQSTAGPSALGDACPSIGSIGHPYFCAGVGCKYNCKARGCKDGRFCVRCHLCRWRRHQSQVQNLEAMMQNQGQQ